jgi:hypothetical protein
VILITSETSNPSEEVFRPGKKNSEINEMQTIQSLASGMTGQQVQSIAKEESRMQIERNREVEALAWQDLVHIQSKRVLQMAHIHGEYCNNILRQFQPARQQTEDLKHYFKQTTFKSYTNGTLGSRWQKTQLE